MALARATYLLKIKEKYRGKIKKWEEILVPLSRFLNGEIKLAEFLAFYKGIMLMEALHSINGVPLEEIEKLENYDCSETKERKLHQ